MHFLRTLVSSAILCVAGAYALTVPVGGYAGENDMEITIKIHHEQSVPTDAEIGISEQLVFSMIKSRLRAHILMLLVYLAL